MKNKTMKNKKGTLKLFLSLVMLLTVVIYSWLVIHESAHAAVCMIEGHSVTIASIYPRVAVNCNNLVIDNTLMISDWQYFALAMAPYLLALIISTVLLLLKKCPKTSLVVSLALLIDVSVNFFSSTMGRTDFTQLAIISKNLLILAMLPVAATLVITGAVVCRELKKLKVVYKGG